MAAAGRDGLMRAAALLALLAALAAAPASAALPPPPFDVQVAPARVAEGRPVTITLTPRGGRAPGEAWDVYLVWALSERAAFLAPDGQWSPRPVAYRLGLGAGESVTATWTRPAPAGEIPLGLVVVAPGADPLVRADWVFRPVVRTLRVTPAAAAPPRAWHVLGPLALVALLAVAVVCATRRPFLA